MRVPPLCLADWLWLRRLELQLKGVVDEAPPSSDVSGDGDGWLPSGNLIVDLPLASVGNSVLGLGVEVVGDIAGAEPPPSPVAPSIVGWRSQKFTRYCWPGRLKYTRVYT